MPRWRLARQLEDSGARILFTLNLQTLYKKVANLPEDCGLERLVVCSMSAALPFPENALFTLLKRHERATPPNDERHIKYDKLIDNDGAVIEPVFDP